jgi:amino acid transporter
MKHLGIWFLTKSGTEYEIVTQYPLDGSFIRLAGHMVDPALGVAVGWNHFASSSFFLLTH